MDNVEAIEAHPERYADTVLWYREGLPKKIAILGLTGCSAGILLWMDFCLQGNHQYRYRNVSRLSERAAIRKTHRDGVTSRGTPLLTRLRHNLSLQTENSNICAYSLSSSLFFQYSHLGGDPYGVGSVDRVEFGIHAFDNAFHSIDREG